MIASLSQGFGSGTALLGEEGQERLIDFVGVDPAQAVGGAVEDDVLAVLDALMGRPTLGWLDLPKPRRS
jgi:hypothetical protein